MMVPIILRKCARHTSLYRRWSSLSALEQVTLGRLRRQKKKAIILLIHGKGIIKKELLINYLITTIGKIRAIKYMVSPVGSRPMRHVITIASLEPWFCKEFLRFKVPGLRRLHNVLDLPVICTLSNNGSMMSEEVLIRGLYELASGEKQSSIASRFGRHYTDQGRAFQYFINCMFIRYKALVCNNLEWWHAMGFMKYSNQLIEQKCAYSG
jgi:hypothetical protein